MGVAEAEHTAFRGDDPIATPVGGGAAPRRGPRSWTYGPYRGAPPALSTAPSFCTSQYPFAPGTAATPTTGELGCTAG